MNQWRSPLRYPGGKIKLAPLVSELIANNPRLVHYVEPFAGGAGIAINLLLNEKIEHITLNDFDVAIYCFWDSVTNRNDEFMHIFDATEVTIDEWHKQRKIFQYLDLRKVLSREEELLLGFSTFFLNRTNFSGILRGATPVGGLKQLGKWKIDYEYNKERLEPLLRKIGFFRNKITIKNMDMIHSMEELVSDSNGFSPRQTLMFVDPPYVNQGKRLYLPIRTLDEHKLIANQVNCLKNEWLLTYDSVPELMGLYENNKNKFLYSLQYKVKRHRKATEFMVASSGLDIESSPNLNILENLS